jgi:cytochrome c6
MTKALPTQLASKAVIAAAMLAFSAAAFAEAPGEATYKANCQSCHGATGTPSAGMAKMMNIKPAAEYKTSAEEQFNSVKNGKEKMKPFAGKLNDAQIKEAVAYFRTLK